MPESPYDGEFYRRCVEESGRSARVIVPLLLDLLAPVATRAVVDVGCGAGAFLRVFREHGVPRILGMDGPWVEKDSLQIPPDRFQTCDLSSPPERAGEFDLVVCLEVAEHIPGDRAAAFVRFLTGLGPVVLFSAAVPGQGGTHHVNEQWPAYWAGLFGGEGYRAVDCLRMQLWDDGRVGMPYKQNSLLFVDRERLPDYPVLVTASLNVAPSSPPPLVHPELYLNKLNLEQVLTRHTALPLIGVAARKACRLALRGAGRLLALLRPGRRGGGSAEGP